VGVSCLIVGTEDGRVLLLNAAATAIAKEVHLSHAAANGPTAAGAVPAFLSVAGSLNEGYRVSVAARDGRVYNIKNGVLAKEVIQLEAPAVGVVSLGVQVQEFRLWGSVQMHGGD
jgi:Bardet-Biedl syndrome 1 protein